MTRKIVVCFIYSYVDFVVIVQAYLYLMTCEGFLVAWFSYTEVTEFVAGNLPGYFVDGEIVE